MSVERSGGQACGSEAAHEVGCHDLQPILVRAGQGGRVIAQTAQRVPALDRPGVRNFKRSQPQARQQQLPAAGQRLSGVLALEELV